MTEIPVTKLVIKAVEHGIQQRFKSLKFKNRRGVIFHDTDWIARVDYDPNDLEIGTGESNKESSHMSLTTWPECGKTMTWMQKK